MGISQLLTSDEWVSGLSETVAKAAASAGLPERRSHAGAFNGEELVWEWREYVANEHVAADVRLRVGADADPNRVHTTVVALAWPVEPKLRHLARAAPRTDEDFPVEALQSPEYREKFQVRLADRLERAWRDAHNEVENILTDLTVAIL
jgi:hypothetical protein